MPGTQEELTDGRSSQRPGHDTPHQAVQNRSRSLREDELPVSGKETDTTGEERAGGYSKRGALLRKTLTAK